VYNLSTVSAPAAEPVDLDLLKTHMRHNLGTVEDTLLTHYATAVRTLFETYTNRRLITQTLKMTIPCWKSKIDFPVWPVQSITHVKYYNTDGTLTLFEDYDTSLGTQPSCIYPQSYPSLSEHDHPPIEITFVCGYGASYTAVPSDIVQALLLHTTSFYENRAHVAGQSFNDLPQGFQSIVCLHKLNLLDERWL
jgi:uncharacterized phiE125 gp8 family phage protein